MYFKERKTVQEIADMIVWGAPTPNTSPIDLDLHWFHSGWFYISYRETLIRIKSFTTEICQKFIGLSISFL